MILMQGRRGTTHPKAQGSQKEEWADAPGRKERLWRGNRILNMGVT